MGLGWLTCKVWRRIHPGMTSALGSAVASVLNPVMQTLWKCVLGAGLADMQIVAENPSWNHVRPGFRSRVGLEPCDADAAEVRIRLGWLICKVWRKIHPGMMSALGSAVASVLNPVMQMQRK